MTLLEALYRYDRHPSEATMFALGNMRHVYGVRLIQFDEAEKTVRIEYDRTRLNKQTIHQLLRRTGIDLVEDLPLIPPQLPAETAAAPLPVPAK